MHGMHADRIGQVGEPKILAVPVMQQRPGLAKPARRPAFTPMASVFRSLAARASSSRTSPSPAKGVTLSGMRSSPAARLAIAATPRSRA
jgi:hypothetical protein